MSECLGEGGGGLSKCLGEGGAWLYSFFNALFFTTVQVNIIQNRFTFKSDIW